MPTKNAAAAWQKKEAIGCVKGASDWVVASQGRVVLIELKDEKDYERTVNALSDDQKKFWRSCGYAGVPYEPCWSIESVEAALIRHGLLAPA